jgi:signal transduction histidine kinase
MINYQNDRWEEPRLIHRDFWSLFEATNQAMFIENRDGYIIGLNQAACELWGASQNEFVGKHASEVLPPKLGTSSVGTVRRSRYTRLDQTTIEVEVLSTPLTLGDDEAFLTTVWLADGKPELALEPAPAPRTEVSTMEALERLSGRVSHDFNNILTSVVGVSSLMQSDTTLSETCRNYVNQILESAHRAEKLTAELLAFGHSTDPPSTTFHAAAAIEKADAHIRKILGGNISLTTIIENDVAPIAGSESVLGEILLQLATNTSEAMEGAAEGAMNVELASDETGATILHVSDDGPGMDEYSAAAAFEPFFTSRNDQKRRGFGLTKVYSATRNIGGTVELISEHGSGTQLTFKFPAAEKSQATPPAVEFVSESLPPIPPSPAQTPPPAAAPSPAAEFETKTDPMTQDKPTPAAKCSPLPGGSETILVVEDEPMVREIVVRSLTHLGYTVHKACDGQEGLERSRELAEEIDLIFSDIVMPRLSGPEMIQKVRQENRTTPVLLTTGFTESKHLLENGGDLREGVDLLQKPYTLNVLAERVRKKLDSLLS